MKLILWIILTGVVVIGGLYLFSRKLLYFPAGIGKNRLTYLRSGLPGVEEIEIPAHDGVTLHGWVIQKDVTHLPFIFYFGGNAEEVSLNMEDYIREVDANLILVNYRGYGLSKGTPTEKDLKSDALAVYDVLADRFGFQPGRAVAWGRSLGSSMASYLALERGLGGLILTCPFDSIQGVADAYYPAWLVNLVLQDRHRTIDFASRIQSRTLVLAAPRDEVIPAQNTRALYERLSCEKELVDIEGAGHNTISEFDAYFDAVARFLKANLKTEE